MGPPRNDLTRSLHQRCRTLDEYYVATKVASSKLIQGHLNASHGCNRGTRSNPATFYLFIDSSSGSVVQLFPFDPTVDTFL
mmetsp:Transcript_14553/g.17226  ORF Transcript_14553/g.17226 Transcript_14553/m.17226 type:complete len:81 (-) Transcript_14553:332-574(-)